MFLTTNTFGGTAPRLAMHGLDDRVRGDQPRRRGDRPAWSQTTIPGVLVAGNIGPSGELIAPLGLLSADEAADIFADQAAGLAEGGADFFLIETMSDMAEVEAAIAGARRVAPDLEIVATMSFDTNLHTMMGVSPAAAVQPDRRPGDRRCRRQLWARSGARWRRSWPRWPKAVRRARCWSRSPTPGCRTSTATASSTTSDPTRWPLHARRLRDLGVDVIGGCCGSTPQHVAAMVTALTT